MKILFVHLSDFHFNGTDCVNTFQTHKLVDSLKQLHPFDRVCVILSGDITKTGEKNQFSGARYFVGLLISEIRKKTSYRGYIDILCVPGNHDMNQKINPLSSNKLQGIKKVNSYDKHIDNELQKLEGFFELSTQHRRFLKDKICCQDIIKFGNCSIEINLINSAIFSSLEEDKGLHYIPQQCINRINTPTGADLVITVMHHAPEWYKDDQKILLENAIFNKSSIVFLGHEHYLGIKTISSERNIPTFIQAGGCLCQSADWTQSEFHVGSLDTETMKYTLCNKRWNIKEQQYETKFKNVISLIQKPSIERKIVVPLAFIDKLINDEKHDVSDDFRDYYVFPRVQTEGQNGSFEKEIIDETTFLSEIQKNKRLIVVGGYNSGKTSLLKYLFLKLSGDYSIVFCDVTDIRGKDAKRVIRNCFEEIYGDNPSDFERFVQLSKENRMLFIDNVDQISSESLDYFVSEMADVFEYMIFTSVQILDMDLVNRMKNILKATGHINRYKLTSFYTDKREELINKIVRIKIDDKSAVKRVTKILSEAIKTQRNFVSLDPDFIIKYVEYYCINIGEASYNDSGVFSKVFENSLITAIGKYQTNRLSVDKIFILLSKIAHYIHFNKAYPITHIRLCEIIEEYNRDYGTNVIATETIDIIVKAKVLTPIDDNTGYRFANKNYLAFFVAKEVNSRYYATNDETDLKKLLQCACFGINSDILLFISYITDNIRILRLIITMADEFTKEWGEFQFGDKMPQFLIKDKVHKLESPSEDSKLAEKEAEIEAEKRLDHEMKAVEIYDYSEDAVDEFANQIIRACSLLVVVAKCLPSFEHLMPKSDKDTFVELLFRVPNRIFLTWANEVDKETEKIIKYFKEQAQDFFIRQKKMTDDDILRALQWGAMSLLLDLYNLVVFYSVKDNTFHYLNNFNYTLSETYSLEHLMMIEKKGIGRDFVESALQLSENKIGNIYSTILMRIVHHALVFMENLDFRQQQKLKTEYFPAKEKQKELMAQRSTHLNQTSE